MRNSTAYLHGYEMGSMWMQETYFACFIFINSLIIYFYVKNVYICQSTTVKGNNFNFQQCQIFNGFQFQIKKNQLQNLI